MTDREALMSSNMFPTDAALERELELADRNGISIITREDPGYPPLLRLIYDPPAVLYVQGRVEALSRVPVLAVVGSRDASDYGLRAARRFGSELSQAGFTVVSGCARGVDTAAHVGVLDAGGVTVAVLGSGLLRMYPPENECLAGRIAETGCVVSEFPLTAGPRREHFPRRNRIVSGLSQGVLLVEAAERSGALITARFALEQGRDVFCLPGTVDSAQSRGTNALIKQGAFLVDSVEDIRAHFTIEGSIYHGGS